MLRVPPSVPSLCAMGARCWVGGSPSPLPPSAAARVRRRQKFGGGGLVTVCPLSGSCALRAHWEPSSGSYSLSRGGSPALLCSPPRSLAAHRWRALLGGGSPPPSTPRRLLALGACNRSGGPLSSLYPLSGSCTVLALREFSSPPLHLSLSHTVDCGPWPSSPVVGPTLAWPLSDTSDATLL